MAKEKGGLRDAFSDSKASLSDVSNAFSASKGGVRVSLHAAIEPQLKDYPALKPAPHLNFKNVFSLQYFVFHANISFFDKLLLFLMFYFLKIQLFSYVFKVI